MRLTPGGVREPHWHQQAEWAYMLFGRARITAVDQEGRNFIADVGPGDLWYFPAGIPHSIQGLEEAANFCWSSMMDIFLTLTPYPSPTGLRILQKRCCQQISVYPRVPLTPFLQGRSISIRSTFRVRLKVRKSSPLMGTVPQSFKHRVVGANTNLNAWRNRPNSRFF